MEVPGRALDGGGRDWYLWAMPLLVSYTSADFLSILKVMHMQYKNRENTENYKE